MYTFVTKAMDFKFYFITVIMVLSVLNWTLNKTRKSTVHGTSQEPTPGLYNHTL